MSTSSLFVVTLVVNTIEAFVYLNVVLLYSAEQKLREMRAPEEEKQIYREGDIDMKKILIFFFLQLLCPVVGPLFVGLAFLFRKIFFREEVDLSNVMFSKEKVVTRNPADVERESNMVPLEEALAVTDAKNLRSLMLNVIRGDDIGVYLASIAKGLNSSDSETAHYAASVLRDELNDFRSNVQVLYNQLDAADKDETGIIGIQMLTYMNAFLVQHVFAGMEQRNFVTMMAEAADAVYERKPQELLPEHYEWVCMRLLEVEDYAKCEEWTRRAFAAFPEELSSYTCMLKLYFRTDDQERFFDTMFELQQSNIVLDQETLDLIRVFA